MKIRIAVFENTLYNYSEISESDKETSAYDKSNWVRKTEWVEVELPLRNPDEVTELHLKNLAEKEQEIRAERIAALNQVEKRRKELLALPAPLDGDLLQEEIAGRSAMDAADQAAESAPLDDDLEDEISDTDNDLYL